MKPGLEQDVFALALLDTGTPLLYQWFGEAFLLLLLLIVVIETVVLRLMEWSGTWRCLFDAFLTNLVSTLLGFTLVDLLDETFEMHVFLYETFERFADHRRPYVAALTDSQPYAALFLTWVLSVLIEGAMLWVLLARGKRRGNAWLAPPSSRTWRAI